MIIRVDYAGERRQKIADGVEHFHESVIFVEHLQTLQVCV